MAYTVLARRYRSQTFDDVIGQDAIARTLKNAIESGRVAHAYLFTGTRGVGKTTMARILAKSLNCLKADGPTVKPCLKCDSCVSINTGEDIDVIEIDGASNTGVDNIRQLRENAIYRPARARFKIYIIDEVHMLSTGAFNALLKILEEPPDHVKFIFATTEPNKILATIQSRCQRFDFANISAETIGKQLKKVLKDEKIKFEDDLIVRLSRLANGSMRDSLSLLDQLISTGAEVLTLELLEEFLGQPSAELLYQMIEQIAEGDSAGVLDSIDRLLGSGRTETQIAEAMIEALRDIMVVKTAPKNTKLVVLTEQEHQRAAALAEKFDVPAMIYQITSLEKIRYTLRNTEHPRALLEATMLRLAMSEAFISAAAVMSHLSQGGTSPTGSAAGGVKKKSTPADEPAITVPKKAVSVQREASEAPAEIGPVLSGWVNTQTIEENWDKILTAIKTANTGTGGYLSASRAGEYTDNCLAVEFPKNAEFAMQICQKRQTEVNGLFSKALGTEITVKFVLGSETMKPKRRVTQEMMSSQKRKEILDDPSVQTLLTGLDARVIDISEAR